uniref:Zinc finger family protein n=1 Tax=Rhizophora mucronata TaxID=61149 RepID=A0A2P2KDR2_RHIMU
MGMENVSQPTDGGIANGCHLPNGDENPVNDSCYSLEKEAGVATCRVCQCAESDKRGDVALGFLGISPPLYKACENNAVKKSPSDGVQTSGADKGLSGGVSLDVETGEFHSKYDGDKCGLVEFISPDGEVFICNTDLEKGEYHQQDSLIELGCCCKNDLALVHYACALKWFVNHGSTVCEICGHVAKNVRPADFNKVVVSLKDYEALTERTAVGDPNPVQVHAGSGVDPDAVAAIRRQRLSEISSWFTPCNNRNHNNAFAASQAVSDQPLNTVTEDLPPAENPATKWAVECTGILLATGLLTVTLAWLIAPRVGKKTARSGLHILLGGICALTVVIFFRFIVLTRIKYGPARYWAILFVFWFLVFGIWASRTHGTHAT